MQVDFEGKPSAAQRLARMRLPRSGTLSAIVGEFDVPSSSTVPFLIKTDGLLAAELPANDDSVTASFSPVPVAADTLLEVFAPDPQDITLSGGFIRISISA